jgi:hypothetical protein
MSNETKQTQSDYGFVASLEGCELRHQPNGELHIIPPKGKRIGTDMSSKIAAAPELLTALEYLVAFNDPAHPKHVALCEFLIDEMARTETEISIGDTKKLLIEIAQAAITQAAH